MTEQLQPPAPRERLIEEMLTVRDLLRRLGYANAADTVNEAMDALATAWGQEPASRNDVLEEALQACAAQEWRGNSSKLGAAMDAIRALKNAAPQAPSQPAQAAGESKPLLPAGPAESASPCVVVPTSEAEQDVLRTAMEWYRWTLTQFMDQYDYNGQSRLQWLACKRLAELQPSERSSP